jgi:hypothetical protein
MKKIPTLKGILAVMKMIVLDIKDTIVMMTMIKVKSIWSQDPHLLTTRMKNLNNGSGKR